MLNRNSSDIIAPAMTAEKAACQPRAARAHARYQHASALFRSKSILSQSHSTFELHKRVLVDLDQREARKPKPEECLSRPSLIAPQSARVLSRTEL